MVTQGFGDRSATGPKAAGCALTGPSAKRFKAQRRRRVPPKAGSLAAQAGEDFALETDLHVHKEKIGFGLGCALGFQALRAAYDPRSSRGMTTWPVVSTAAAEMLLAMQKRRSHWA